MSKILVERKLLEQAREALACAYISNASLDELSKALAEPAVEPVAVHQVKLDNSRWSDIAKDEMQNYPAKDFWETRTLYASPPPPSQPVVRHLPADDTEGGAL